MTPFQIIAAVITLSAIGGYVNYRYLKLPQSIGLMAFAFAASLGAILLSKAGVPYFAAAGLLIAQIDFSHVVLHGMLSFLLFAGALQIDLEELISVRWSVAVLATAGVAISTLITGMLVWRASGLAGLQLPYLYALL